MKLWERILLILSAIFAVSSLLGELFWPAHIRFVLDDLFFPFGILFMAVTFFKSKEWRWLILSFALLSCWGMISDLMAHGSFRISPAGMWLRWLKWPIIMLTVAQIGELSLTRRMMENGVSAVFLALAGLNLFMLLNPFELGEALNEFYAPKAEVLLANYHEYGAFRLSGTVLNPNNNAILFGLFLLYFLHLNAKKYWKYILLAFILIFLTQSRTTLLLSSFILIIYLLRANSRKINLIVIPGGIIGLIGGLFIFRSTNLISILNGSAFQSNSWTERMDHYSILFKSSFSDLLFGHGIMLDPFAQVGFYFDSAYLSMAYQYGVIGVLIWLVAIGSILMILYNRDKKSSYSFTLLLFVFGIGMTNFIFLNVECATLMMFLAGAWSFLKSNNELSDSAKKEADKNPVQ